MFLEWSRMSTLSEHEFLRNLDPEETASSLTLRLQKAMSSRETCLQQSKETMIPKCSY